MAIFKIQGPCKEMEVTNLTNNIFYIGKGTTKANYLMINRNSSFVINNLGDIYLYVRDFKNKSEYDVTIVELEDNYFTEIKIYGK